ncbi:MAG: chromate transporter [Bacteroidales bacterium]|nr:chromate transporter [Bacteroidales bacterium]
MSERLKKYLDLFFVFFKIGAFTFGGGWAMISIIEKEVVDKKRWVEKEEFIDAIAVSQSLPGILAVNISIYTGHKLYKLPGAVVATLGTILPSFIMILAIALFFTSIYDKPDVVAVFRGIRPAVVALILIPVFSTAKAAKINITNVWIPIAGALLIWLLGVSPVYIILGAAAFGIFRKLFR